MDLSRRDAARKMDGWVELAHVVSMAGHKAQEELDAGRVRFRYLDEGYWGCSTAPVEYPD